MCECGHEETAHVETSSGVRAGHCWNQPRCGCTSYRETQEENMTTSDTLEKEAADFIDESTGIFSPFNPEGRPLTTLFADFTRLKVEQAKKQIATEIRELRVCSYILEEYVEKLEGNDGK